MMLGPSAMSGAALGAGLSLPAPLRGVVLARDCLEAEAGWLLVHLLKAELTQSGNGAAALPAGTLSPAHRRLVLLAAAQAASHYAAVLRKAGLNLPSLVAAGRLNLVELLPAAAGPGALPSLRDVHALLAAACSGDGGAGSSSSICLVVDDLTVRV